jgi:hypothetical protein
MIQPIEDIKVKNGCGKLQCTGSVGRFGNESMSM